MKRGGALQCPPVRSGPSAYAADGIRLVGRSIQPEGARAVCTQLVRRFISAIIQSRKFRFVCADGRTRLGRGGIEKAMEYRRLGGTGLKVSELCLGCMTFGRETDEATAGKILGRIVGERRKDLIVATKVRFNANVFMGKPVAPNQIGLSRGHIMSEVEASLRRLKMDYIDLYQVHSWDFETPIEETMRALDDLVRQGKVRYIGASNFTAWQLMKSLWVSDKHDFARFDCLQPQYSLISREIERELLPMCRYESVGVIPWSPLGGGFLTGKYRSGQRPPADSRLAKMDMWNRLADERNY